MRSLLFASALGSAQSLAVGIKSNKPAVQGLLESAAKMLKNGATEDVTAFAEETLAEVTGTVIPAIISESVNDQNFIDKLHKRFEEIEDALKLGNVAIEELNTEEVDQSKLHKECRAAEHDKCYDEGGKRKCEMKLDELWTAWVTCEGTLKGFHNTIHGKFCAPGANGTTEAFRVVGVEGGTMSEYIDWKAQCDAKLKAYDDHVPTCVSSHNALNLQTQECDSHQTALEVKACAHANKVVEVKNTFYTDYARAESAYNCAVEEVKKLESDRKQEWITLSVVQCLLERVREQNGVPCDTATNTVSDEIAFCEEKHGVEVCSSEGEQTLCLNYPDPPEKPPMCDAPKPHGAGAPRIFRDENGDVLLCLAKEMPAPHGEEVCASDFTEQEYAIPGVLEGYPEPPFSEGNPGCNAYPACSPCAVPDRVSADFKIDSCPGYTVDGCGNSGNEDTPLTYVRAVDGKADVRCCDDDGGCQSKGFEGGVDFITPNDGEHTQCYFDVTYQKAMEVCHKAGKRICTTSEMSSCCGTGCWHNHHAIWVDIADKSESAAVYQTRDQNLQHVGYNHATREFLKPDLVGQWFDRTGDFYQGAIVKIGDNCGLKDPKPASLALETGSEFRCELIGGAQDGEAFGGQPSEGWHFVEFLPELRENQQVLRKETIIASTSMVSQNDGTLLFHREQRTAEETEEVIYRHQDAKDWTMSHA